MPTATRMRAIFIDAEKREIRDVEYSKRATAGSAPVIRDYIHGWLECAFKWASGDVMFVDEEGLMKPTMNFFVCSFRPDQPMAGNGLVVGREVDDQDAEDGYYTVDPVISADWLKRNITWMDRAGFDRWALAHSRDPAATLTSFGDDGIATTEVLRTYGDLAAKMPREPEPGEEGKGNE